MSSPPLATAKMATAIAQSATVKPIAVPHQRIQRCFGCALSAASRTTTATAAATQYSTTEAKLIPTVEAAANEPAAIAAHVSRIDWRGIAGSGARISAGCVAVIPVCIGELGR